MQTNVNTGATTLERVIMFQMSDVEGIYPDADPLEEGATLVAFEVDEEVFHYWSDDYGREVDE